jgi:alkanesulfonate monooxygenase SsuD/methylene tetrahydromethanopterin reductase-like flavin-dependent oxidoreductase (luciferase family)
VFLTRHGHHPGAWRQPGAAKSGRPDFRYWAELAKTAERGKFDVAFFADFVGQSGRQHQGDRAAPRLPRFRAADADRRRSPRSPSRIGIVATVNTNFDHPYALARRFASLDHISGGRIGWNIVSSLADGARAASAIDQPLEPCRTL